MARTVFDTMLGAYMRTFRKEKKIPIEFVAEELEVSVPAVHYWETGQRQISASNLKRYCACIGIKVQELFDAMDGVDGIEL